MKKWLFTLLIGTFVLHASEEEKWAQEACQEVWYFAKRVRAIDSTSILYRDQFLLMENPERVRHLEQLNKDQQRISVLLEKIQKEKAAMPVAKRLKVGWNFQLMCGNYLEWLHQKKAFLTLMNPSLFKPRPSKKDMQCVVVHHQNKKWISLQHKYSDLKPVPSTVWKNWVKHLPKRYVPQIACGNLNENRAEYYSDWLYFAKSEMKWVDLLQKK